MARRPPRVSLACFVVRPQSQGTLGGASQFIPGSQQLYGIAATTNSRIAPRGLV
ncbi:MAG: hypothetical protein ACK5OB_06645 [Pirellula sp.]